jgi:hypothetical protein
MEMARGCVDASCCDCWTGGCGLDGCFGQCADCLEAVNPCMELVADSIWILGSPLAFPIVFCFNPDPENSEQSQGPGGGWQLDMMGTPCRRPFVCCAATACPCAAQWYARRQALQGDMTRYKLWQGYHDGPQCLARRCPSAPITIESGTYGEQSCPHAFLCLEVTCLGCIYSPCCAHDVTRRLVREERGLGKDPTEIRLDKCVGFFGRIMRYCCACAMYVFNFTSFVNREERRERDGGGKQQLRTNENVIFPYMSLTVNDSLLLLLFSHVRRCTWCCSCLIGVCASDSGGAQECSGEAGRASRACFSIARTLWRGIMSTKVIAMGCMVAQQHHELTAGPEAPPKQQKMER